MSDVPRLLYADSSALVKLLVAESESAALKAELTDRPAIVTSGLARVEVARAVRIQTRGDRKAWKRALDLVESLRLIEVMDSVLTEAAAFASAQLRTLDAIHLASALRTRPDAMITYDRRLAEAAVAARLNVLAPA